MSCFVHTPNPTRIGRHYAYKAPNGTLQYEMLRSKFGIQISPVGVEVPEAELMSGKDMGRRVTTIGANQRAALQLGSIHPPTYQGLVAVNPQFNLVATVQAPQILEPKQLHPLEIIINAHREVRLADFEWFIRIYLVE
jgi:hypothetical protein